MTAGDYICLHKKLCARRILSYLKRYYLEGAAHQLERETAVFFDVSHLQYLARNSRWDDLVSYVTFFFKPSSPGGQLRSRSPQAWTFLRCLDFCRALGGVAAKAPSRHPKGLFPLIHSGDPKYSRSATLCELLFQDFRRQRPPRDYTSWVQIWEEAAKRLKDLALECPELKGKLHLPPRSYAPKHCQISLSGVRPVPRPFKKKANKQKARDIAYFINEKRHAGDSSKPFIRSDDMIRLSS